jgi:hypothetical protein
MKMIGKILVPGVGSRGDILKKPGSLEEGYELGRRLGKRKLNKE